MNEHQWELVPYPGTFGVAYWELRIENASVTIEARRPGCDRGFWYAKVQGIRSIDFQDGFPRYYMNLDRAKLELEEWLVRRLKMEKHDVNFDTPNG